MKYSAFMKYEKENNVEKVKKALSSGRMTNKNYNAITAKMCVEKEAKEVLKELVREEGFIGISMMDNEALRKASSIDIELVLILLESKEVRSSITIEWLEKNLGKEISDKVKNLLNQTRKIENF